MQVQQNIERCRVDELFQIRSHPIILVFNSWHQQKRRLNNPSCMNYSKQGRIQLSYSPIAGDSKTEEWSLYGRWIIRSKIVFGYFIPQQSMWLEKKIEQCMANELF